MSFVGLVGPSGCGKSTLLSLIAGLLSPTTGTTAFILITLVCFFPITVALTDGLQATDPDTIKLYQTFGAGSWRIFWSLRFPGAVPALFSGVRIAISYSILSALFSEYIGSTEGLGFYMQLSQKERSLT